MTDKLASQIRSLVVELVETAPPAPSLAEIELLEEAWAKADGRHFRPRRTPDIHHRGRPFRLSVVLVVAAAIVIVASVLIVGVGGNHARDAGRLPIRSGTWSLADDVLTGTWSQYTAGPPPGTLTCPTTSTCYAMSGHYSSPFAGSPLLGESLYASSDAGQTWTQQPMPRGFAPTSPIACGAVSDCAAGGTDNGRAVLASTSDGGRSWTLSPLPDGVGHLDTLSCPVSDFCAGLAGDSEFLQIGATNATFLSTNDDGRTFTDKPIVAGDSMQSLTCTSHRDCTAIGWNNAVGPNNPTAGVAARTTDGGRSWSSGSLPGGLGVSGASQLSCADALHCFMTGMIAIPPQYAPQCAGLQQLPGTGSTTIPTSPQSPAVAAVAQTESQAVALQLQKEAGSTDFSCGAPGQPMFISALASTRDGGLTWTPDSMPIDVPQPLFSGLSCPTDTQCWVTGSDAVPRQVGITHNGGQPILLGTTDGGSTWSNVTFSVPEGAPNAYGQSYLSLGGISCPSAGSCLAMGTGAQSAPSVPVYSLVTRGSG